MIVVTARNGAALRELAKQAEGNKHIAIFPESGLSPTEQAGFLKANANSYTTVITFSPFIISDAEEVNVIDDKEIDIEMGSSVNKIVLHLWRKETIGDIALTKIKALREQLDVAQTKDDIDLIITDAYELGDSIERLLFIKTALDKLEAALDD